MPLFKDNLLFTGSVMVVIQFCMRQHKAILIYILRDSRFNTVINDMNVNNILEVCTALYVIL